MYFYRLQLSYKGTQFSGFQVQPDRPTIQGELNRVLAEISKSDQVKTIGSGRTDAGVHAFGQVVRVEMPLQIQATSLMKAVNAIIHKDIEVVAAEESSEEFHPIMSSKNKVYHYLFTHGQRETPFARELITFAKGKLDLELMKSAMDVFVGEHDFKNFRTVGTDVPSTVRTISSIELECREETPLVPRHYVLKIQGNGFLKQMVRLIMGALFEVAKGKATRQDIENALVGPEQPPVGPTAPPQGLYLVQVDY